MNNAENAFNSIYPTVLRVAALRRRWKELLATQDFDQMDAMHDDFNHALDDLVMQVEGIEAGCIDDSLTTSIAGTLNRLRRQAKHN